MTFLKKTAKHTIYEVWNEWTAESVFIDHKPSKTEVEELVQLNWPNNWSVGEATNPGKWIKKYIHVERLRPFYVTDKEKKYSFERGED